MSPEQLRSAKHVDARTDIWALGVILYELVVGARPFEGESPTDVAIKIATSSAPRITGSGTAVQPIVDRCLQKDPRDRYQDISHFMSDLETLLATGSVPRDDDAFQRTGERTARATPSALAATLDARATIPDRTLDETGRGPVSTAPPSRTRGTRSLVLSSVVVGVVIGAVIYYVAPPRSASRASPLPSPTTSLPAVTAPSATPPDAAHSDPPPEPTTPEPVATKPPEQAPAVPAKRPPPKTRPRGKTEATKDDVGARWR